MTQKTLDATPEKRVFLSIISEYDLKRSICELIDNAIDLWSKNKRADLKIKILADQRQQTLSIEDNAGGVEESKLDHIVSPGKTSNDISDDVIGYFGVGSKRAVVALAENIAIHSRFEHEKPFVVKFDDHWINQDPNWSLPYEESNKALDPFTTLIELSKLRIHLTPDEIENLKIQLGEVYANFIKRGVVISVDSKPISAISFDDQWTYPPGIFPKKFSINLEVEDRAVDVEIITGLIDHPGDPDNSYGVFLYCNNRLIVRALTDFNVGFIPGMVGNPHYNISLVRTIVKLKGQSRDMPWDSSKSGIDTKHLVFQALRQGIIDVTSNYAKFCRSMQGRWEADVFAHKTGHIEEGQLNEVKGIPRIYLPTPPPSRKRWHEKVIELNKKIISSKPWSSGLLDSVIAVDLVSKMSLGQKNRISLILLDSVVEIGYKEYLLNEQSIGITKFKGIAENRADVQTEVFKTISISPDALKKINFYYKLRCDLIHQRATPNITDTQIEDYRSIIVELLEKMFGLKFP